MNPALVFGPLWAPARSGETSHHVPNDAAEERRTVASPYHYYAALYYVQKRYVVHVAACNLGWVMRALLGAGTPRELAAKGGLLWWFFDPAAGLIVVLLPPPDAPPDPTSSTGC